MVEATNIPRVRQSKDLVVAQMSRARSSYAKYAIMANNGVPCARQDGREEVIPRLLSASLRVIGAACFSLYQILLFRHE
jgi:hypothetical protein